MGCDIHMHTEIKLGGTWHHYGQPNTPRCYALFALLAGVRSEGIEIEPISQPKGLPLNTSIVTEYCSGVDPGHSHSWLSSKEIAIAEDRWAEYLKIQSLWTHDFDFEHKFFGYLLGNSWADFHKYPESRPQGIEDVRWVFWFDN